MTLSDIFWGIGDFCTNVLFIPFEHLGNIVNYIFIVVFGFGGLFYWLNLQRKFNAKAANDPNVRK